MTRDEFRERQALLSHLEERCVTHRLAAEVLDLHITALGAARVNAPGDPVDAVLTRGFEERARVLAGVTEAPRAPVQPGVVGDRQARARMLERAAFGEGYLWPLMKLHMHALARLEHALRDPDDARIPFDTALERWVDGRWSLIERGKL